MAKRQPKPKLRYVPSYKSMEAEPVGTLWLPGHQPIKGWQDENAEIIKCYHHDGERTVQIVRVN